MQKKTYYSKCAKGFTLVEMSIVLVLLSLMAGGGLHALNAHIQHKREAVTQERFKEARSAVLHFIQVYGRLPCPSVEVEAKEQKKLGGWESKKSNGQCLRYDGFLPAQALGMSESDDQGFAVDGWDRRANRIRYAVAQTMYSGRDSGGCSAQDSGEKDVSEVIVSARSEFPLANLYWGKGSSEPLKRFGLCVCSMYRCADSKGISAAAVIYTLGENAYMTRAEIDGHEDEIENLNQDRLFVAHTPTVQFDDHLIWISSEMVWGALLEAKMLDRPSVSLNETKEKPSAPPPAFEGLKLKP
jgi:prepilin-type N-terminal cleavage/methylation domain-containing protein